MPASSAFLFFDAFRDLQAFELGKWIVKEYVNSRYEGDNGKGGSLKYARYKGTLILLVGVY